MRRHAKASSAASTSGRAGSLGRFFRGAFASRDASSGDDGRRASSDGSRAPKRLGLLAAAMAVAIAVTLVGAVSALGLVQRGDFEASGEAPYGIGGIDVNQTTGDIYAANAIDNFSSFGALIYLNEAGEPQEEFGQAELFAPSSVAVNQELGYIYATEADQEDRDGEIDVFSAGRVHLGSFDPEAPSTDFSQTNDGLEIDSSNKVYVALPDEGAVHKFGPTGGTATVIGEGTLGQPFGLAIDGADNLYVADRSKGLLKFNSAGELDEGFGPVAAGLEPVGVDVSGSGEIHLFVVDGGERRVIHYDAEGNQTGETVGSFEATLLGGDHGIAWAETKERLYVPEGDSSATVYEFGVLPPGPPFIAGEEERELSGDSVELHADVNPAHNEMTGCNFEYLTKAKYEEDGESFENANVVACDPQPEGSGSVATHTSVFLHPITEETTFVWRVLATNTAGPSEGETQEFTTLNAEEPEVRNARIRNLGSFEAEVLAVVFPNNSYVEECTVRWGPTEAKENEEACNPSNRNVEEITISRQGIKHVFKPLEDNTTYHWEVEVVNNQGTATTGDLEFTTPKFPDFEVQAPTEVGPRSATFNGIIENAERKRVFYQFQYSKDGFETVEAVPPFNQNLGCPEEPVELSDWTGRELSPNTEYEVRLYVQARERCGFSSEIGPDTSEPLSFTTPAIPPTVDPGVGTAGSETANLHGYVNPNNQETTAWVEWGTTTSYGNRGPNEELAAADEPTLLSAELSGLTVGTTIHYRVVAENAAGRSVGPDQSVITTDDGLLQDRAIELVTPQEGSMESLLVTAYGTAAADGESFVFHSRMADGEDAEGTSFLNSYKAERTADGWKSHSIAAFLGSDHSELEGRGDFHFFDDDLTHGIFFDFVGPGGLASTIELQDLFLKDLRDNSYSLLSPVPPEVEGNYDHAPALVGYSEDWSRAFIESYRSGNHGFCGPGSNGLPCEVRPATGEAQPVAVLPEHIQQVQVESDSNPNRTSVAAGGYFRVSFEGEETEPIAWKASAEEFEERLLEDTALEAEEVSVSRSQTMTRGPRRWFINFGVDFGGAYHNAETPELEGNGAELEAGFNLVAAGYKGLPKGSRLSTRLGTGPRTNNRVNQWVFEDNQAVSDDGTRAVFVSQGDGLFLRDTGVPGSTPIGNGTSIPGRTIELPCGFHGGNSDLSLIAGGTCRYDVENEEELDYPALTDPVTGEPVVNPETGEPETLTIGNVLRRDADASHLYFECGGGTLRGMVPGIVDRNSNLCLWYDDGTEDGALQFVSTANWPVRSEGTAFTAEGEIGSIYTTPDGRFLLFASPLRHTGYRQTANCQSPDVAAQAGSPCTQVYVFDAQAPVGSPEKLRCASCHPEDEPFQSVWWQDIHRFPKGYAGGGGFDQFDRLTEPRYISDDGRSVFFQSHEPLLPRDVNEEADIYEYDVPSGQLSLITTGKAAPGAAPDSFQFRYDVVRDGFWILDSSADGDVFFITYKALLPQDTDGLPDVYVARKGGGFEVDPPESPCEGEACRKGGTSAPADMSAGSPDFVGPPDPEPVIEGNRCRKFALATLRNSRLAQKLRRNAIRLARAGRRGAARKVMRASRQRAKRAQRFAKATKRCRRANRGAGR